MSRLDEKRQSISEVSELTEVPIYVLRQWENRFKQLKPKRNRANRRYYLASDIEIVRRIKQLLWHEKMTTEGARKRLDAELHGIGRPKTQQETIDLLDQTETKIREALELLESE